MNTIQVLATIWKRLLALNLFATIPPAIDESEQRHQRLSTVLFIVLLFEAVIILGEYTALVNVSKTNIVNAPTLEQYSSLYPTYSQSLICPCSQVSIEYEAFIRIRYDVHQICHSFFVSPQWYQYLTDYRISISSDLNDYRSASLFTFQALGSFCKISSETISTSLNVFLATRYVTATVTPLSVFQALMQAVFDEFVSSTRKNLLSSLQMISDIDYANGFMSLTGLQYTLSKNADTDAVTTGVTEYGNCSCVNSPKCVSNADIYGYHTLSVLFTVPGMYRGCIPTEALLQSSLICFYDQTCIDQFLFFQQFNSSIHAPALTTSASGRFLANSTVEELVDQLMVEAWNFSAEHSSYFNACRVAQCSYTYMTKNDALFVITTVFGLIGGLVKLLRFAVPLAVDNIFKLIKRVRRPAPQSIRSENGKTSRSRP